MVESLVLGYKALEIAALHAFGEEEPDEHAAQALADGELGAASYSAWRTHAPSHGGWRAGAAFHRAADGPLATGGSPTDARNEVAGGRAPLAGAKSGSVDDGNERTAPSQPLSTSPSFSWKDDFGRPDTMIDALGAQRALEVVEDPEPRPEKGSGASGEAEFGKREMAVSMALGLVLGVVLFIAAPAYLTNLVVGEYDSNTLLWNVVDGLLRVGVFVLYLWLIGRMSDIKRMFGYHGAEHKAIHCYEHGLPLTPENARSFPRLHVRCGTAFLIMVMIIAIFVYTVTPINGLIELWGVPDGAPKLLLVILARILLMPVIAGVSYEITVKWAGSRPENPLVKVVLWPGMQMQYLTTNEPDDGQIECAIAAMERVLERERARREARRRGRIRARVRCRLGARRAARRARGRRLPCAEGLACGSLRGARSRGGRGDFAWFARFRLPPPLRFLAILVRTCFRFVLERWADGASPVCAGVAEVLQAVCQAAQARTHRRSREDAPSTALRSTSRSEEVSGAARTERRREDHDPAACSPRS